MYKKIFTAFIIILIIGISITGLLSIEAAKNIYYSNLEKKLTDDAYLIAEYAYDAGKNIEEISIMQIQPIREITKERITIINLNGRVIYDSDEDISTMDNHRDRPEIQKAIMGKEESSIRYSDTLKIDMMYVAIPKINEGQVIGVIRVAVPLNEVKSINTGILRNILFAAFIGIMIASIFGYRYLYYITHPIKELTSLVKEIAGGNFSRRITMLRKDELGELATSFNEMANHLQYSIEELKEQNAKLETILGSMINGIIAVDINQNVILINPSAREIFGVQEYEKVLGKNILEIIRNNQIYKTINNIITQDKKNPVEIQIDYPQEKTLKIFTNPIKYLSKHERIRGIIIIIQDVTKLRKLENIRKDFAANVSHELKTPITSIKGFVETLRNDEIKDEKTRERFLEIIDFESERLIRLVEDILTLSQLENPNKPIHMEEIEIGEILNEVIQMTSQLANKKNITIKSDIQEKPLSIYFTRDKLKQMLINIIDNAIKYTANGGTIKVSVHQEDARIVIEVKDNGIGIPREDIPRLFERFYRVDKARSRSAGGTGLGLAIVKHIVQSMNGKIQVESELGKGTRFIIYIPINIKALNQKKGIEDNKKN